VALLYADASALVKLVREEPESEALTAYLRGQEVISSELILTEIPRAIRRAVSLDPDLPAESLLEQFAVLVQAISLRSVDRLILTAAGAHPEPLLRALDAVHVASAMELEVDAFVTYDLRQADAARRVGLQTAAPS
jgi:uncharacterized protein